MIYLEKIAKKIAHKIYINSFKLLSITFFIALILAITTKNIHSKEEVMQVSFSLNDNIIKSLEVALNEDDFIVQEEKEKNELYEILIYYPVTKYEILNKEIVKLKENTKNNFIQNIDEKIIKEMNAPWYLSLNFNSYSYLDILGFAFHTDTFTGGAHPNAYINTINYDKKNNCIVTIDSLISKNSNILNELSKYTYDKLLENEYINEYNVIDMLKEGTNPTKNNFSNFVFTPNGLMIFFQKYQVAPYVLGEFTVTVPYDVIGLEY